MVQKNQQLQVFFIHTDRDRPTVRHLCERLYQEAFVSTAFLEEPMLPGHNEKLTMRTSLKDSDVVIFCLSPHVQEQNGALPEEITFALSCMQEHHAGMFYTIALKLKECEVPLPLQHVQTINFFEQDGYYRFMRALRKRAGEIILVGQTIGEYYIEGLRAKNGIVNTFHAHHSREVSTYATIHVIHASLVSEQNFQAQFERFAFLAKNLSHPNIIKIFDFNYSAPIHSYYLVTESIPPDSLQTLFQDREHQPLSLQLGIELIRQVANALAFAHSKGIIHGHIRPDTIGLAKNPLAATDHYTVKIRDFALAPIIEASNQSNNMHISEQSVYISPEQSLGSMIDGRSDIYTLGVLLYEIATGRFPVEVKRFTDPLLPRVINPYLTSDMEDIILRCLAKSPEHRFSLATDLAQALEKAKKNPALKEIHPISVVPPDVPLSQAFSQHIQIVIEQEELHFIPGRSCQIAFVIHHRGTLTRHLTLSVVGIPETWIYGLQRNIRLKPLDKTRIVFEIAVPRSLRKLRDSHIVTIQASSDDQEISTAQVQWNSQTPIMMMVLKGMVILLLLVALGWFIYFIYR